MVTFVCLIHYWVYQTSNEPASALGTEITESKFDVEG